MDDSKISPRARGYTGIAFTMSDFGDGPDDRDPRLAAALAEIAGSELPSEVEIVPGGRGWGGSGNALVLVFDILERVGGVSGGLVVVAAGAKRVAQMWRRIRKRTGQRPDLSLGALVCVCLTDLAHRLDGQLDGVVLVSATDLTEGLGATTDHSGTGQPCVVVFGRFDRTWTYLVDSQGNLYNFGVGWPLKPSYHWATGQPSDASPLAEPPQMLLADLPDELDSGD